MQRIVILSIVYPRGYPTPTSPRALIMLVGPAVVYAVGVFLVNTWLVCPPRAPALVLWALAAALGVVFLAWYRPSWLGRASPPAPRVLEGMTWVGRASGHPGAGFASSRAVQTLHGANA